MDLTVSTPGRVLRSFSISSLGDLRSDLNRHKSVALFKEQTKKANFLCIYSTFKKPLPTPSIISKNKEIKSGYRRLQSGLCVRSVQAAQPYMNE